MNFPTRKLNSTVSRTRRKQPSEATSAATLDDIPLRRLRILVIDEEIPYPLNSGKRIRTWNLLHHLASLHQITFLCYGTPDDPGIPLLERVGIRAITVPPLSSSGSLSFYGGALTNLLSAWPYSVARHHTRRFLHALRQLTGREQFDLLHCEWTPYASFMPASGGLPVLVMAHNIETTVWRRRAEHGSNIAERFYMGLQALKMSRFEKRCFSQAARVATVTSEEQQTAREWGARATSLVSNGVDTTYLQPVNDGLAPEPRSGAQDSLLFLGSLDWQPNRDALVYLLSEILPRIQAENPRAVLQVVGRQPATKLREQVEGHAGVEWVGEVPDIRPWFARAAAVLVPLRIGGGSRIKILESMAMAKAVVTTSIGAEGLEVVAGKHCLIADTPEDFAYSVTRVLRNPALAAELGNNGRALVVEQYDWSRQARALERAWMETVEGSPAPPRP